MLVTFSVQFFFINVQLCHAEVAWCYVMSLVDNNMIMEVYTAFMK